MHCFYNLPEKFAMSQQRITELLDDIAFQADKLTRKNVKEIKKLLDFLIKQNNR